MVRATGLGYTIVRPGPLQEEPGGYKALVFDQGNRITEPISIADVADAALKVRCSDRMSEFASGTPSFLLQCILRNGAFLDFAMPRASIRVMVQHALSAQCDDASRARCMQPL